MRDEGKRAAIREMIASDPSLSDSAIAKELGVSNHLVYAVRHGHRRESIIRNDYARWHDVGGFDPDPDLDVEEWGESPRSDAPLTRPAISPVFWFVVGLIALLALIIWGVTAARRNQPPPKIAPAI